MHLVLIAIAVLVGQLSFSVTTQAEVNLVASFASWNLYCARNIADDCSLVSAVESSQNKKFWIKLAFARPKSQQYYLSGKVRITPEMKKGVIARERRWERGIGDSSVAIALDQGQLGLLFVNCGWFYCQGDWNISRDEFERVLASSVIYIIFPVNSKSGVELPISTSGLSAGVETLRQ